MTAKAHLSFPAKGAEAWQDAGKDEALEPNTPDSDTVPVPVDTSIPAHLEKLVETARDYARGAKSANTLRAYAADWRHYEAWCFSKDLDPLPPSPQVVGLYLAACADQMALPLSRRSPEGAKTDGHKPGSVRTIERRLSAITWMCAQKSQPLDRADPHIREVMQGIRRKHWRPPNEKEAVSADDVIRMSATLGHDLRSLRDRAILLLGFAGAFRRSEIFALDCGPNQTDDGQGWVEFVTYKRLVTKDDGSKVDIIEQGLLVHVRTKSGWRAKEIGPGSTNQTCPIVALKTWLDLARIAHGPIFRRVTGDGKKVGADRMNDKHAARLVKGTVLDAGVGDDITEGQRREKYSGHSLRAGLASSADIDERLAQKQLGHASLTMTRRYQRNRERFRVNLTKAAGL